MKKRLSLFLTLPALIGLNTGGFAAETPRELGDVTLRSGRTLSGAEVLSVEPDGLRVQHRHGVGKVKLEELPPEIQERFKLDTEAAAVYREQKRKEANEQTDAARKEAVRKVAEASKEQQQQELDRQRREVFAIVATGDYDFVAIDNTLRQNGVIWKEAGREDLAAVLEEDRQLIKSQQVNRPAAEHQQTVETLNTRIQGLEQALREARQAPPPEPITETVYVERPVPVLSPVFISPPTTIIVKPPGGRPPIGKPPIHHPHPRPPGHGGGPGYPVPPGRAPMPVRPSPPATVSPVVRPPQVRPPQVRPATGVTPGTVQVRPGGAHVSPGIANGGAGVSGAHQWNR